MKGGDASAESEFDDFYRSTAQRVVHLVYASTGDLELARDATQEAFARAWQRWDQVRATDEPGAWVRTVARRIAISAWRKDTNRLKAMERHGEPSPPGGPTVDRVAVVAALRTLGPEVRETLALHYLADLSVDEISRQTGAPPGTIKARLHRGRAQLAKQLTDKEAHDD
ncbi:RNA polymerase sigma factor [Janibacter anophelis]|uniref:RNA polymerase sigma factor n=1 Tax=Janibacter anophelis TaxID=319054 RepID=UPI00082F8EAD|nr:SigE family RNA polymerase sigma factor [Janibacter anophelis]